MCLQSSSSLSVNESCALRGTFAAKRNRQREISFTMSIHRGGRGGESEGAAWLESPGEPGSISALRSHTQTVYTRTCI